jgi:hypothetical protein
MVATRRSGTSKRTRTEGDAGSTRKRRELPVVARPSANDNLSPTAEELSECSTQRSRSALLSWYDRLRDLYAYKEEHGDCMVPQKYTPNDALGTVR